MKVKITRNDINTNFVKVYSVSYCGAQSLLSTLEPFGYNAGVYGWNYDAYNMGNGICITTGYRPIGEHVDVDKLRLYEQSAERILYDHNKEWQAKQDEINNLLSKFISEVLA